MAFGPRNQAAGQDGGRSRSRCRRLLVAVSTLAVFAALAPAGAGAVVYGPQTPIVDAGGVPPSVAVNQTTHDLYLANYLGPEFSPGNIARYSAAGASLGTFGADLFGGVAINPVNQNVYAVSTTDGDNTILTFSATGTEIGTPFPIPDQAGFPRIDTDAVGDLYVPNGNGNNVSKFDSTGTELDFSEAHPTIDCADCPAPASFDFTSAVAVDSSGDIYVVDRGHGRVVKFDSTGAFDSVLMSGSPTQVAVDPATDDVFVGVAGEGETFHVLGFDSAGVAIPGADFGEGLIQGGLGSPSANQLAVDGATGTVYVADVTAGFEGRVLPFAPVHPTAVTTAAAAIANAAATLKGTVNPNEGGAITECLFEWGTTTSYSGGTVPCASKPPNGESAVAVSAALSGLAANTTYHYQLVVDNGTGPTKGGDQTLKTLPDAPTVVTGGATGISQSAATLAGTVNPNSGNVTACKFEYGTSTSYGSQASCASLPGSGATPADVSAALGGLAAGTTYHYRLVATNAGGTTNGLDTTFATASPPPPTSGGGASTPPPSGGGSAPPVTPKPLKCKKGFKKKTVKGKKKCVKVKKHKKKH